MIHFNLLFLCIVPRIWDCCFFFSFPFTVWYQSVIMHQYSILKPKGMKALLLPKQLHKNIFTLFFEDGNLPNTNFTTGFHQTQPEFWKVERGEIRAYVCLHVYSQSVFKTLQTPGCLSKKNGILSVDLRHQELSKLEAFC